MNDGFARCCCAGLVRWRPLSHAQTARTFKTRLSPVPVAGLQSPLWSGGTVTATLTGTKLTIAGTFEGLAAPATHRARSTRAPSPASAVTRSSI